MDAQQAVSAMAALAQTTRLAVFRMLVVAGPAGLSPSELSVAQKLSASALSFHLKELLHAELVTQQRDGRRLIYRARFSHVNALMAYLTEHCCQGEVCAATADLTCQRDMQCC